MHWELSKRIRDSTNWIKFRARIECTSGMQWAGGVKPSRKRSSSIRRLLQCFVSIGAPFIERLKNRVMSRLALPVRTRRPECAPPPAAAHSLGNSLLTFFSVNDGEMHRISSGLTYIRNCGFLIDENRPGARSAASASGRPMLLMRWQGLDILTSLVD